MNSNQRFIKFFLFYIDGLEISLICKAPKSPTPGSRCLRYGNLSVASAHVYTFCLLPGNLSTVFANYFTWLLNRINIISTSKTLNKFVTCFFKKTLLSKLFCLFFFFINLAVIMMIRSKISCILIFFRLHPDTILSWRELCIAQFDKFMWLLFWKMHFYLI